MMKIASGWVLGSIKSSTNPGGYACGFIFACGLAGDDFAHPVR